MNFLCTTVFVLEGANTTRCSSIPAERGQLYIAHDWKMLPGIGKQLMFPPEIATRTLRKDLVLWSPSLKEYIIELTVPWEDSMEEAYEQELLRYAGLDAEAQHHGWKTEVCPVQVGCRGFVGPSTIKVLRDLGIRSKSQPTAIKAALEAAERRSQWLWLKRKDPFWAAR